MYRKTVSSTAQITRKTQTVVTVDGFSVPGGVDTDHVPDLFRVVAADRQPVIVSHDGRVVWSRGVSTTGHCTQSTHRSS